MKKLFILSAFAVLTACGGSDNKPAGNPSTTNTTSDPSKAATDATKGASDATKTAPTDAKPADAKPADPTKK